MPQIFPINLRADQSWRVPVSSHPLKYERTGDQTFAHSVSRSHPAPALAESRCQACGMGTGSGKPFYARLGRPRQTFRLAAATDAAQHGPARAGGEESFMELLRENGHSS